MINEGLVALKDIKRTYYDFFTMYDKEQFDIIEKELKDYKETKQDLEQVMKDYQDLGNSCYKKCKAFDIIKEKKVNIDNFINTCSKMSYEQYKFMWETGGFLGIKMTSNEFLAKDEYDLLKEALL